MLSYGLKGSGCQLFVVSAYPLVYYVPADRSVECVRLERDPATTSFALQIFRHETLVHLMLYGGADHYERSCYHLSDSQ